MFVGLDVHKRETQVAFVPRDGGKITETRVRTTPSSLKRVLKDARGPVVLEAVGFHRPIVRTLQELGCEVHLANPRLIPKPAVKTDKKDARHLAKLLKAELLPESWVPPEEIQLLRDLVRHRRFLGEESARLKSKIKHDLYKHGHFVEANPANTIKGRVWSRKLEILEVDSATNLVEATEREMKRVDEVIDEEAANREETRRLATIPGIAEYTALGIFAEVGDFTRFQDPEKLASYAGFAIRQQQSGDRDRRGGITKEGNALLRTLLVEATFNHVRVCPESRISAKYARLKDSKGHSRALVAAARHLVHTIFAMMRDKTEFTVNPKSPDGKPAT